MVSCLCLGACILRQESFDEMPIYMQTGRRMELLCLESKMQKPRYPNRKQMRRMKVLPSC